MSRRLFTILSAVSLVLCVGAAVLWVGSEFYDRIWLWSSENTVWQRAPHYPWSYAIWEDRGRLCMARGVSMFMNKIAWNFPAPNEFAGFAFTTEARDGSMPIEGFPNWFVPRIYLQVPFWFLFSVTAIAPISWVVKMKRARRRQRLTLCLSCGYDLRATPDRCPECGRAVTTKGTMLSR